MLLMQPVVAPVIDTVTQAGGYDWLSARIIDPESIDRHGYLHAYRLPRTRQHLRHPFDRGPRWLTRPPSFRRQYATT